MSERDLAIRLAVLIIGQNRRGPQWCDEVCKTLMQDLQDAHQILGDDLTVALDERFPFRLYGKTPT